MRKEIWFDMDGTIADLYGVEKWLEYLMKGQTKPYRVARPLVDMRTLAKELKRLQAKGYKIGIISWLAKCEDAEYDKKVTLAKLKWLKVHIGSVEFDEIHIVPYGTPKQTIGKGILFDDEIQNREQWIGKAFDVDHIIDTLKAIA